MIRGISYSAVFLLVCVFVTLFAGITFSGAPIPLVLLAVVAVAWDLPQLSRHTGSTVASWTLLGGISLEFATTAPPGFYLISTLLISAAVYVIARYSTMVRESSLVFAAVAAGSVGVQHGILAMAHGVFPVSLAVAMGIGTVVGMAFRFLFRHFRIYEKFFQAATA